MVCEENGTFLDINIPSVMLPQSAGDTLEAGLLRDETGTLLVCSSYIYWSDFFSCRNFLLKKQWWQIYPSSVLIGFRLDLT